MNVPERKGNYSAKKSKYQGKYKDKYKELIILERRV